MRTLHKQLSAAILVKFSDFARIELMLYALQAYFRSQAIGQTRLLMQGNREPIISDRTTP